MPGLGHHYRPVLVDPLKPGDKTENVGGAYTVTRIEPPPVATAFAGARSHEKSPSV
jgi:hypothetical protein